MEIRIGDKMFKIIENDSEYEEILAEIEKLMDLNPSPYSEEGKKLHLLKLILTDYEKDLEINQMPEPKEAIKFMMEQQGLKQRDLIPFIGSRSLVSEVLSGKRNLTLEMIWALNEHLGIPLNVLSQKPKEAASSMLKAS